MVSSHIKKSEAPRTSGSLSTTTVALRKDFLDSLLFMDSPVCASGSGSVASWWPGRKDYGRRICKALLLQLQALAVASQHIQPALLAAHAGSSSFTLLSTFCCLPHAHIAPPCWGSAAACLATHASHTHCTQDVCYTHLACHTVRTQHIHITHYTHKTRATHTHTRHHMPHVGVAPPAPRATHSLHHTHTLDTSHACHIYTLLRARAHMHNMQHTLHPPGTTCPLLGWRHCPPTSTMPSFLRCSIISVPLRCPCPSPSTLPSLMLCLAAEWLPGSPLLACFTLCPAPPAPPAPAPLAAPIESAPPGSCPLSSALLPLLLTPESASVGAAPSPPLSLRVWCPDVHVDVGTCALMTLFVPSDQAMG